MEIEGEKFDILNEKELWKRGDLCSPPWVTWLTMKELKRLHDEGDNIIIAGSPRTVYEAEREMPLLSELYGKENIHIVLVEISAEEVLGIKFYFGDIWREFFPQYVGEF